MTQHEFNNLKIGTLVKFNHINDGNYCIGKLIKYDGIIYFKKIFEHATYVNYFVHQWELYPEEYFNNFDIISNEEYMILRLEHD